MSLDMHDSVVATAVSNNDRNLMPLDVHGSAMIVKTIPDVIADK